jgi:hypothetical protein
MTLAKKTGKRLDELRRHPRTHLGAILQQLLFRNQPLEHGALEGLDAPALGELDLLVGARRLAHILVDALPQFDQRGRVVTRVHERIVLGLALARGTSGGGTTRSAACAGR